MGSADTAYSENAEKAVLKGYAKVNLYLDVCGRCSSGKHLLQTVMHTVSLYDAVAVRLTNDGKIALRCYGEFEAPEDSGNIAYKCAEAFFREIGSKGGAVIEIEKRIPTQAGLGGGSADGAAVLRGLNMLCGGVLSAEEICRIGASAGADIPFCSVGGCGLCTGPGEIIEPLPPMKGCVLLAKGAEGISTAAAYSRIDEVFGDRLTGDGTAGAKEKNAGAYGGRGLSGGKTKENIREIFGSSAISYNGGSILRIASECMNIFEQVTENADVRRIKAVMNDMGAAAAMMTGSGSAVFGLFESVSQAGKAAQMLRSIGFWSGVYEFTPGYFGG